MSKERTSPELQSADQVMEAMDPSDETMPLLSVTENLSDDVIFISQLTPPLPSLEDHLWINHESGMSTKTVPLVKAYDKEMESPFGLELIPAQVMQQAKVIKHKCSECGKVFRTTNALNKHLLSHQPDRPHACNICQRRFKRQDHLTAHMRTHQEKAHCCTKPGCHKVSCNQHSLKCCTPDPPEPSSVSWEPPHPPAVTEDQSSSKSYHSLSDSPPKSASVSQLEQFVSCGARYRNYTGCASIVGNTGSNRFPKVNLPVIREPWCLAAVDLPAPHGASNQWPPSVYPWPGHATVDLVAPDDHEAKVVNVHGWEDGLNFPLTNPQSSKGVLSVHPCKKEINAGTQCLLKPFTASPKKSQPVLLKQDFQFTSGAQSCSISDSELRSVAPPSNQRKPCRLPPPPPKKGKKTTKTNVPVPPLRATKPKTKTQSRPHPPYLISPSQVAMASFSTESTPSFTIKGEGAAAIRQNGKDPGRTHLTYSPDCHVQPWPLFSQAPTISSAKMDDHKSMQGKKEGRGAGQIQESHGFQLSPLVIPVSVPVLGKESPFNKPSVQSAEKQHNINDLSRKSCRSDLLRSLIIPNLESGGQGCRAAGGYPSQLRSPTYLVDHLLKPGFQPPPYTPPPMLSPLRPGTGLYFSTLPHFQPCPPPPSTYTAYLDGKDNVTLMTDNVVVNIEPKINVGPSFQAEIPPLRNLLLMLYDEHPAQLVWAPWGDLPSNPETQQKVTEFLNMCCSSVLPGGGTNTELALHCLHEVQGDVLAALDLLLLRGDYGTSSHQLSDYHYTGLARWSAQEIRLFRRALFRHKKDFQQIHNMLKTKSVAQCVEYYYAMKKLKKLKQHKKEVKKDGTAEKAEFHSAMEEKSETNSGIRRSLNRAVGTHEGQYVENREYACQECGRSFPKVKSRSAHMRIHRHQEQEQLAVDNWPIRDPKSRRGQVRGHLESSGHLTWVFDQFDQNSHKLSQ